MSRASFAAAGSPLPVLLTLLCMTPLAIAQDAPDDKPGPLPAVAGPEKLAPRERLIPAHQLTETGELVAVDLLHGFGNQRLRVERTWTGLNSTHGPFGAGWHDSNAIRLKRVTDSVVVITRGPIVWLAATEIGEGEFKSPGGHTIQISDAGSVLTLTSGMTLEFDGNGLVNRVQSPDGTTAEYIWSADGQLQEIALGPNNMLRYLYDDDRVVLIEGPEGLHVEYVYADGRLVELVNGWQHRIRYLYQPDGSLVAAFDSYGDVTSVPPIISAEEAAAEEELATDSRSDEPMPPDSEPAADEFTSDSLLPGQPKPSAYTVTIRDTDNALLIVQQLASGASQIDRDDFGRISRTEDQAGRRAQVAYNHLDMPIRIEWSDGNWKQFHRNEHGQLSGMESSTGARAGYAYDARGRLASIHPNDAVGRDFAYDDHDRVTSIQFSDGREVEFTYDVFGRHVQTVWSSGARAEFKYDSNGRLAEKTVNGLTTTYQYNEQGQLVAFADPLHGERRLQRDQTTPDELRVEWGTDVWTYRGQVSTGPSESVLSTQSAERRIVQLPNESGSVAEVITTSGRVWSYQYDENDRLKRIELPGGQATDLELDHSGNILKLTRDGIDYRTGLYGPNGQLQMTSSPLGIARAYAYDRGAELKEIIEPNGKIRYQHDERGLPTAIRSDDYLIRFEYFDDASLARQYNETASLDLRLPRDDWGRPAGISLNDVAVRYEYDEFSRISAIVLPGDVWIWILRDEGGRPTEIVFSDNARMGLTWDYHDRMTSVGYTSGPDNLLMFFEQYAYDPVGNLVVLKAIDHPTRQFTYDDDDRLTSVESDIATTTFEYDANDNLESVETGGIRSHWLLDRGGRPLHMGARASYTWDELGNLTGIDHQDLRIANRFDAAGRLIKRQVGNFEWTFGYSPDGDRLWMEGPQGRTWYTYMPEGLAAIKDESGTPWLIVNLPGTDRPLALCGPGGATMFVVTDHLSSIRRVLDPAGQVLSSTDYGEYGQVADNAGSVPLSMYAGMIRDNHGLYCARGRYYDPGLLRFISIDPRIGSHEFPVSHNSYSYAGDNPLRFRHIEGLTDVHHQLLDLARVEQFE